MNLEPISVENNEYHREYFPNNLTKAEADHHNSAEPDPNLYEKAGDEVANPQITWILQRISAKGLYGRNHVKEYLVSLHRGNCRSNTIRSYGCTIILFCHSSRTSAPANWKPLPVKSLVHSLSMNRIGD